MKALIVALILLLPAALAADPIEAHSIEVISTDDGFLFTEGAGTRVLAYQRRPNSIDGTSERAHYIHPLYDLDGNVLTEDFPEDHLHHHGIFWAWHQVLVDGKKAGDSWNVDDFSWDVQRAKIIPDNGHSAALKVKVIWTSPQIVDESGQPRPLVEEKTTIRVHRSEADNRKIDFEIQLRALLPGMQIGGSENAKGYGGFSPRIRLPENIRFVGEVGELTPEVTAIKGGAWLDMTASFGEDASIDGLAILQHPSLPGFPQAWILRSSKSMQNPVYPGREPVALSTETPTVLRYRLVVHRGETNPAQVQQWWQEYAQ